VPVENFYEWKKTGKGKQPYAALVPSCPVWKGCRHSARRIGGRPLTHLRQSPERENYL
jgi:hypothetical protein